MTLRIKFLKNWNKKLDCDVFTTIRSYNPEKFDYYNGLKNETFDVMLDGNLHCKAKLINMGDMHVSEISPIVLMSDTGSESYQDALEVFKKFGIREDSKVIVLIFKREK